VAIVSQVFLLKFHLPLDCFLCILSRKDIQTVLISNNCKEKHCSVLIGKPQRTALSSGLQWMPIWSSKQGELLRDTVATMMTLEPREKHVGERIDQLEPSYRRWLLNTQLKGPYRHMIRDVSIPAISSDVQGKLISAVR
jgi:hypothetical protein